MPGEKMPPPTLEQALSQFEQLWRIGELVGAV
jgi:hypothetical protein